MAAKLKKYPVTYRRKSQVNSYTGDTPAPVHSIVVEAFNTDDAYALSASVPGRQDIKVGQPKVRRSKKAAVTVAPENPNDERRETTYFPPQPCPTVRCCEGDDDGDGNCPVHSAPGVYRRSGIREPNEDLFADKPKDILPPQSTEEVKAYEAEHSVPEVVTALDVLELTKEYADHPYFGLRREYVESRMTDAEADDLLTELLDDPNLADPARSATKAILCTALLVLAGLFADSTLHLHKLTNTQGSVALLIVGISFIIAAFRKDL